MKMIIVIMIIIMTLAIVIEVSHPQHYDCVHTSSI